MEGESGLLDVSLMNLFLGYQRRSNGRGKWFTRCIFDELHCSDIQGDQMEG